MLDSNVQTMILNTLGAGASTDRFIHSGGDPGVLRPWLEQTKDGALTGRSFITVRNGRKPDGKWQYRNIQVHNAPAILTRRDWLTIDARVNWAAKLALQFWPILRREVPFDLPNGMATVALQHTIATGDYDAQLSMDPIRKGERSRPTFDTVQIPVPVHHSDGSFSARQVMIAQGSQMPLDTTSIELATRKIGENIEQLALGTLGTYKFAAGTIYGALNLPQRYTQTFTHPATVSPTPWTAPVMVNELLVALQTFRNNQFRGPFALLYSKDLAQYFDGDYQVYYAGETLKTRLRKITNLTAIESIDYMPANTMILIQLTPDVVDAVNGLDFTTVQWDEQGGMEKCFKVMAIMLPRFKYDALGRAGVMQLTSTPPTTTSTTTTTTTTTP